jgi:hypothetical protein
MKIHGWLKPGGAVMLVYLQHVAAYLGASGCLPCRCRVELDGSKVRGGGFADKFPICMSFGDTFSFRVSVPLDFSQRYEARILCHTTLFVA